MDGDQLRHHVELELFIAQWTISLKQGDDGVDGGNNIWIDEGFIKMWCFGIGGDGIIA